MCIYLMWEWVACFELGIQSMAHVLRHDEPTAVANGQTGLV